MFAEVLKDALMNCYRSTKALGRYDGRSVPGLANKGSRVSELLWTEGLEETPLFYIVHRCEKSCCLESPVYGGMRG